MKIEKLIQGNQEFIQTFKKDEELFKKLADHGQYPKVLWIGCSDSRVIPEFIVNVKAGDLFVVRNIANIVPPQEAHDLSVSSVLEYAVLHLEVEHIVVCGHTSCGGITSLVKDSSDDSSISQWLEYAKPAFSANDHDTSAVDETIKNNILLQARNLLSYSFISEQIETISIHKWLYDIKDGSLAYYDENLQDWTQFS